MKTPIVNIQNAYKKFGKTQVLKGLNLQIQSGTIMGILGKNGAGKTTLLKSMLGILKISEGHIDVFGEDAWELSAQVKSRIGYVPQKLDLQTWMNVRQLIDYTASFYERWNHALANDLLNKLELPEDSKVKTLSGGQTQALGLILALGHEPELVVLDEPAASLDPTARRRFLSIVLEIVKNPNRTVLFSTHLTGDLERVADTVAIMKNGVIDFVGNLDDLKDSVKKIKISARGALPEDLKIPGLLHIERKGQEALVSVRGLSQIMIKELETRWNATIEMRDMNLEDIFIEVHRE